MIEVEGTEKFRRVALVGSIIFALITLFILIG
jgi:hypothetical protein